MRKLHLPIIVFIILLQISLESIAQRYETIHANKAERVEWFGELGLGMFIHWNLDAQLGSVISHWMVGASDDVTERFIKDMPKTFNPSRFDAEEWARLAKVSGCKYVVFTTKHHSGFCMWDTETTDFDVVNSDYGKDVFTEITDAFRKYDIAIGVYFSPWDFWWEYKNNGEVKYDNMMVLPRDIPGLLDYNKKQLTELMTNYGDIDIMFFDDGFPGSLKDHVWELNPNTIITRGEMKTPENYVPDDVIANIWEGNTVLGVQWSYKPTHENYSSGTDVINMLAEIKAKGGNLLLNVGPDPKGEIPFEQERLFQELGLWMFTNQDAIYNTELAPVSREDSVWYTKEKDKNIIYAIVTGEPWEHGKRKSIILTKVKANKNTIIEILGQSGRQLEHKETADVKARWKQDDQGLHISAVRAFRYHADKKWPNAIVLKIENAEFLTNR